MTRFSESNLLTGINMENELITGQLPPEALEELKQAKQTLEHHGLADRLTELIGAPITASIKLLPGFAGDTLNSVINKSLKAALEVALKTLGEETTAGKPRLLGHKLMAGLTGAAGGAFGLSTVAIELPVSTVLILRSIADIARSQGEDLKDINTRLACLEVFAIDGGRAQQTEKATTGAGKSAGAEKSGKTDEISDPGKINDETEIGYFAVRAAMSKQIADASKYVIKNGLGDTAAPPLVKLIGKIGNRFGMVVSEKVAAQAIPVIGAVGGALINSYFIDHYQDLARAHFTVRRLEREHGAELIREAYHHLKS